MSAGRDVIRYLSDRRHPKRKIAQARWWIDFYERHDLELPGSFMEPSDCLPVNREREVFAALLDALEADGLTPVIDVSNGAFAHIRVMDPEMVTEWSHHQDEGVDVCFMSADNLLDARPAAPPPPVSEMRPEFAARVVTSNPELYA